MSNVLGLTDKPARIKYCKCGCGMEASGSLNYVIGHKKLLNKLRDKSVNDTIKYGVAKQKINFGEVIRKIEEGKQKQRNERLQAAREVRKIRNKLAAPYTCRRCGAKTDWEFKNTVCIRCYIKETAERHAKRLGDDYNDALVCQLEELYNKQNGYCAYTGDKLIPRKNMSLDHKIPVVKGGTNRIDNLQWIRRDINIIKSSFSHEEFLNMCLSVANYHENNNCKILLNQEA